MTKYQKIKSETKLIVKHIQIINLIIMKLRLWHNVYILFVCLGLVIQLQIPQFSCGFNSLVYTYFIATNYSNGVGSQVLATLVTTLPLHIQINQSM